MKLGIIGVGLLGSAVASRARAAGIEVRGYDNRPDAVTPLVASGVRLAKSVAEAAAGMDAVLTVLSTPAAVESVWLDQHGLIATAAITTTLLQMSTVSPALSVRLGEAAAARGFRFLEVPISGTSTLVTNGGGTLFVGGDPAVAEATRPLLEAIAAKVIYVGPVGDASVAKLAANLIGGLNAIALAEALVLGAKAGVAPARLLAALKESPVRNGAMDMRGPLMVAHDFPPHIRLDLFLKDFTLMLEEGKRLGMPLPLTSVAHQLCTATSAAGRGDQDLAAVITTLEHLAGMNP